MSIYLDTSNLDEVRKYIKMGIISGVTTNPSILHKEGAAGGMKGLKKRMTELSRVIAPYPLSVEVTTNHPEDMIAQAKTISGWAKNIVVKIAVHGPNGEMDNMSVIHQLETKHDIRVNVTAMMNAQQCFLAALSGASYVSLLGGRVNNMGYNAVEEIKKLRILLDRHKLKAKIILASTREVLNIVEWLCAGADIVTVSPHFIEGMFVHPYTKETVQMFLADAQKAGH